jgi:dynein heavy chain
MAKRIDEDGNKRLIPAKGLYKDAAGFFSWKPCLVESYDKMKNIFAIKWLHSNKTAPLHRIYFCLDAEDPRKFSKRVANAFK